MASALCQAYSSVRRQCPHSHRPEATRNCFLLPAYVQKSVAHAIDCLFHRRDMLPTPNPCLYPLQQQPVPSPTPPSSSHSHHFQLQNGRKVKKYRERRLRHAAESATPNPGLPVARPSGRAAVIRSFPRSLLSQSFSSRHCPIAQLLGDTVSYPFFNPWRLLNSSHQVLHFLHQTNVRSSEKQ